MGQGDKSGDLFGLRVGLEIAKANYRVTRAESALQPLPCARSVGATGWQNGQPMTVISRSRNAFDAAVRSVKPAIRWVDAARRTGAGFFIRWVKGPPMLTF
jgi:hypothetical protein